ncbi:MAG: hypothetical protein ACR2P1_25640 [Pseudomonadales bacterium]
MKMKAITKRKEWTTKEVQQVATLYMKMQAHDAKGEHFVKSHMTKPLAEKLGRSVPSIECKMMNISHVLNVHGIQWLRGYKPLANVNSAMFKQLVRQFNLES